jgi:hypothetical protein
MDALEESAGWTRAYLEWMDESVAMALGRGRDLRQRDLFREVMLRMVSRAERDCEQVAQALDRAEHVLEDDCQEWRTLRALGSCDRRRNGAPTPATDEWQGALEELLADMRALESKVLALRSGVRAH